MIQRLLLTLLSLIACDLCAAEPPYTDKVINVLFPSKVSALVLSEVQHFEKASLGYRLRYAGPNLLKVDVLVFQGGEVDIPEGPEAEVTKIKMQETLNAIRVIEKRGDYIGVKELASGVTLKDEAIPFLWSKVQYMEKAQGKDSKAVYAGLRFSETYLVGFRSRFIKVRATYKSDDDDGEKRVNQFMHALARLLQNSPKRQATSR
jgi:hypothetical protein